MDAFLASTSKHNIETNKNERAKTIIKTIRVSLMKGLGNWSKRISAWRLRYLTHKSFGSYFRAPFIEVSAQVTINVNELTFSSKGHSYLVISIKQFVSPPKQSDLHTKMAAMTSRACQDGRRNVHTKMAAVTSLTVTSSISSSGPRKRQHNVSGSDNGRSGPGDSAPGEHAGNFCASTNQNEAGRNGLHRWRRLHGIFAKSKLHHRRWADGGRLRRRTGGRSVPTVRLRAEDGTGADVSQTTETLLDEKEEAMR